MTESITWVRPAKARGGVHLDQSYISIGWAKSKNVPNPQVTINFTERAMKDFRWMVGDRIEIGFDDCCIYIRRAANGSYKLTSATAKKNADTVGTASPSRAAFTRPAGFPFPRCPRTHIIKEDVSVTADGIVSFIYPQGDHHGN